MKGRNFVSRLAAAALFVSGLAGCNDDSTVLDDSVPVPVAASRSSRAASRASADPAVAAVIHDINETLATQGLNLAVETIEFFKIGRGRPENRIHQAGYRFVPNDPRRLNPGIDISYLVDQSDGDTASGLTSAQTEAAIDRAMDTWDRAIRKVDIVKRPDSGADPDIVDGLLGFGEVGTPLLADIVHAGWLPRAFFEALAPGGGRDILAASFTFIFLESENGPPTDINGDNYLDEAFSEIYYNDNFGDPGGDRAGNPWGIDAPLPAIDVETVALHESGHSLGLGHFGAPPVAVMNPFYSGIQQSLFPTDRAGLNALYSSWPHR